MVKNKKRPPTLAVLIEKCDLHGDYWTVFKEGKLEVWWEPNIVSLSSESHRE
tara:strand:+ start:2165 stop:2320 length:156 start_codon:yes stop_codon:yes gene_type:complete